MLSLFNRNNYRSVPRYGKVLLILLQKNCMLKGFFATAELHGLMYYIAIFPGGLFFAEVAGL